MNIAYVVCINPNFSQHPQCPYHFLSPLSLLIFFLNNCLISISVACMCIGVKTSKKHAQLTSGHNRKGNEHPFTAATTS